MMACHCIKLVNKTFSDEGVNTALDIVFSVMSGKTFCQIRTMKADSSKREKPKTVAASFCPFCGKKYDKAAKTRRK